MAAHNNTFLNENETSLYREQMPWRNFIAKEEKLNPDFKTSKDRLTPLLEVNAAGDLQWKPMPHLLFQKPYALKNYVKSTLLVLYQWTNKL